MPTVSSALIASALIGAGTSAITAQQGRKAQGKLNEEAKRQEMLKRQAAVRDQNQGRERERARLRIAAGTAQSAQNAQSRTRGILERPAPSAGQLSSAILDDRGSTNG